MVMTMKTSDVVTRNAEMVNRLKEEYEKVERIKNAAPKMLAALKAALYHLDGSIVPKTRQMVTDAIDEAEGRK